MEKIAEKMAELAERFGPHVIDAARGAVRVEAYSSMASGILCLSFAAACAYLIRILVKKIMNDDWDEITWMPVTFLGIGGAVAFGVGVWAFIDPWTWTAISQPDLYIAKRMLKI